MTSTDKSQDSRPWALSEHGDALEQTHFEQIQTRLPSYITNWQSFIGRVDSDTAQRFDMAPWHSECDTGKIEKKWTRDERKTFSIYHYSVLEAFASLWRTLSDLKSKSSQTIGRDERYVSRVIQTRLVFAAAVGHAHDMLKKLVDMFRPFFEGDTSTYYDLLKPHYDFRNLILHYPRRTVWGSIDEPWIVPKDSKGEVTWLSETEGQAQPLSIYFEEELQKLEKTANAILSAVNSAIHNRLRSVDPKPRLTSPHFSLEAVAPTEGRSGVSGDFQDSVGVSVPDGSTNDSSEGFDPLQSSVS